MGVGKLLNLDNSIAAKLIRCLYFAALILILVMVILGLLRGARIMSHPMTLPFMTTNASSPDPAQAPPASQAGAPWHGRHHFMERRMHEGTGPFGLGRNPILGGIFVMLWTLIRGAIVLMIVRVLAELALAVLAMPRRAES